MTTTTKSQGADAQRVASREAFLTAYTRECATTKRILEAYPEERRELRPHERAKTARELAWLFVMEQRLLVTAMTTGFDWSVPPSAPPEPPATMAEIAAAFDAEHRRVLELVSGASEEVLAGTVVFPVAPKTFGDVPRLEFLWFMLYDQIHHRGQLSVYLRMADGKVPSIYGPTADEPWF